MKREITPAQMRAARALLDWPRETLSAACGTTVRTLARVESGEGGSRQSTVAAIRAALEAAGVEFIEENGGGPGVRLRKAAGEATKTLLGDT